MNKEEIFNEISSCFKMSVDINGMKKLEEYITNLQKENQRYKEVIDKIKEWEQGHTILVYTKEAPRQLVGTHELLHLLYEDKEVE